MSEITSFKSLHLEYRLGIAELSYDITQIRIFKDRLNEILDRPSQETDKSAKLFIRKFDELRESIDNLSHRMQLGKMAMAEHDRSEPVLPEEQFEKSELLDRIRVPQDHVGIRNDFLNFRISFNEMKSSFLRFEAGA